MQSTGEVMGIDRDFRKAYLKSQLAAGSTLPATGKVFISVKNRDKRRGAQLGRALAEHGLHAWWPPRAPRSVLERQGMSVETVHKVAEG